MSDCLICGHSLKASLDLGLQPRANALLTKVENISEEYKFRLVVGFCENCKNTQTLKRPQKEEMFQENYAYFSSANTPMIEHFQKTASHLKDRFNISSNSFVIEIGSNDGVFLKNFLNIPHLGIEPSSNVATKSRAIGISCWDVFFNEETSQKITNEMGKANLIFAANVFGHVEEIHSILKGINNSLSSDGVFVFEIYYLPSIIENKSFDLIYDEHIFYYTLNSLKYLFSIHELELFDFDKLTVHGGSIRGYVCHKGQRNINENLISAFDYEIANGYNTPAPLESMQRFVEKIRNDFIKLLTELKKSGHKIAGYGATAKSTTILNFSQVGTELIDFIADSTPFKQDKFTPGSHIPIKSEEYFTKNMPDYTVLFAWNYQDSIIKKQKLYNERGGKWIVLHPEVAIL